MGTCRQLCLPTHPEGVEEEEPIYVRHADRFESETVNNQQVNSFFGNVEIEHSETRITCDQAIYYEHENRDLLNANVKILQPMRIIFADQVEYFEQIREFIGSGDSVRIVDDEKSVMVRGGYVRYNLNSEIG